MEVLGKLFFFRTETHPDGGPRRFVKVLEKLVDQCRRGVAAGAILFFVRFKDLVILKQDIVGMAAHSQPLFVSGKILQNFLKLRKQHLAPPQAQKRAFVPYRYFYKAIIAYFYRNWNKK